MASRIEDNVHKTVVEHARKYAKLWGDGKTALSAGIAALSLLGSQGREKALAMARGIVPMPEFGVEQEGQPKSEPIDLRCFEIVDGLLNDAHLAVAAKDVLVKVRERMESIAANAAGTTKTKQKKV